MGVRLGLRSVTRPPKPVCALFLSCGQAAARAGNEGVSCLFVGQSPFRRAGDRKQSRLFDGGQPPGTAARPVGVWALP